MTLDLQPGETAIDSWSLTYKLPNDGGKYVGKLTVTNRRLLFDARTDARAAEQYFAPRSGTAFNPGPADLGLQDMRGTKVMEINKSDIRRVDVQRSLLSKRATVTLSDGSQHVFDRGMMSIDQCAAAIEAR
jgi:hypothetical protein